ncbi:MAG: alpha/beta hydrolase [Bacteroidetes bacterium]|nr:alpha/beta hydrolase [Bacteroidota bacterium]
MARATSPGRPRRSRRILITLGVLALSAWLAFTLSPWPGALLVRGLFNGDQQRTNALLMTFAPPGTTMLADVPYDPSDPDALLNVYLPTDLPDTMRLPVLVWTHGGGWLSGSHRDNQGYLQLIASRGYVVVSVNYPLAPGSRYPRPVLQLDRALAYLQHHAARFHADMDRTFLAGDSAGGQLAAQLGALITDPAYAAAMGLRPALSPMQLRGLILHCGIYDLVAFDRRAASGSGLLAWGSNTLLWSYTGSKRPPMDLLHAMSPMEHLPAACPPVFISGGNGDPLTDHQSRPLAARLRRLGVEVDTLFFPADHAPALGHEYQFKLNTPEAREALERTIAFLGRHGGTALLGERCRPASAQRLRDTGS